MKERISVVVQGSSSSIDVVNTEQLDARLKAGWEVVHSVSPKIATCTGVQSAMYYFRAPVIFILERACENQG